MKASRVFYLTCGGLLVGAETAASTTGDMVGMLFLAAFSGCLAVAFDHYGY